MKKARLAVIIIGKRNIIPRGRIDNMLCSAMNSGEVSNMNKGVINDDKDSTSIKRRQSIGTGNPP